MEVTFIKKKEVVHLKKRKQIKKKKVFKRQREKKIKEYGII